MTQHLQLPVEAFALFTETSVVTKNFQVLMSAAAIFSLILLTIHGYYGVLQVKWGRLLSRLGTAILIFSVLVLSLTSIIDISDNYKNLYMKLKISDVISDPVASTVYVQSGVEEGTVRDVNVSRLSQILESGVLKVGYSAIDIPFSYQNQKGQLVGYDIAYAYQLASDLDCKLEFTPCDFNVLHQELQAGFYDIAMSSVLMTEDRLLNLSFTHPYHEENAVLVVPQPQKKHFLDLRLITSEQGLKIGAFGEYKHYVRQHFPAAILVSLDSMDPLEKTGEVTAWLTSRTSGFIWCLSHPDFVTIDYDGLIGKAYFSYPVRNEEFKFVSFLNNWMKLKELSGFQQQMNNYWLKGEALIKPEPRWSILRNILHVGD
jgi:ABC-type amino acid transport substrate-binding protein